MDHRLVYARTLCFLRHGEDVLMLQGAVTKRLYPGLFNGVGGHVEAGEDVLAGLRREVLEESGLLPQDPRLAAVINVDEAGKPGVVLFVFVAQAATREVRESTEGRLHWVPVDGLHRLALVPDLHELLPRILPQHLSSIVYGYYSYDENGKLTAVRWDAR